MKSIYKVAIPIVLTAFLATTGSCGYIAYRDYKVVATLRAEEEAKAAANAEQMQQMIIENIENLSEAKVEVPQYIDCLLSVKSEDKTLTVSLVNSKDQVITGNAFGVKLISKEQAESVIAYQNAILALNTEIVDYKQSHGGIDNEVVSYEAESDDFVEISQLDQYNLDKSVIIDAYKLAIDEIDTVTYSDDDLDGIIEIKDLEVGEYIACFVPVNDTEGFAGSASGESEASVAVFSPMSYACETEITEKVEYKADANIEKKAVSYNASADDKPQRGGGEEVKLEAGNKTEEKKEEKTEEKKEEKTEETKPATTGSVSKAAISPIKKGSSSASVSYTYDDGTLTPVAPADTVTPTPTEPAASTDPTTPAPTEPAAPTDPAAPASTESATTEQSTDTNTTPPAAIKMLMPSIYTQFVRNSVRFASVPGSATLSANAEQVTIYSIKGMCSDEVTLSYSDDVTISSVNSNSASVYAALTDDKTVNIVVESNVDTSATITVTGTIPRANNQQIVISFVVNVVGANSTLRDANGNKLYTDGACTKEAKVGDYDASATYYTDGTPASDNTFNNTSNTDNTNNTVNNESSNTQTGNAQIGIDVSKFQGNINWSQAAPSISYAIIRCGGRYSKGESAGQLYEDPMFYTNMSGAKNNGVPVGIYFYSTALTEEEAVEEASLAVAMASHAGGCSLPIFIDQEDQTRGVSKLSPTKKASIINAFCSTVQSSGYKAGVYASANWLQTIRNGGGSLNSGISIWVAQYASSVTAYTGRYDIWQYSSKGSVPGISGNVDVNKRYY